MTDTTYPRLHITPLLKAVLRQWLHLLTPKTARRSPAVLPVARPSAGIYLTALGLLSQPQWFADKQ